MKTSIIKSIFSLAICLGIGNTILAQSPQHINYQSVVRNSAGEVLAGTDVGMQISILKGSSSGLVVYTETHAVTTNDFGLVNIRIGDGTSTDDLADVKWADDSYFLEVAIDPEGGTNYTILGASEMVSVPYAFVADNVVNDAFEDADADSTNEFNDSVSLNAAMLHIYDGGGMVSADLSGLIEDDDSDPTNEHNTAAGLTGTDLEITDGAGTLTVDLSALVDDDDADPTNEYNTELDLTGTDLELTDDGGTLTVDLSTLIDDDDADPENEFQILSISNDTLSISDGNEITLPSIAPDIADVLGYGNDADDQSILNVQSVMVGTSSSFTNNGVRVEETGNQYNYGTYTLTSDNGADENIALYAEAEDASNWNMGALGRATASGSAVAYGSYGEASGTTDFLKRGVVGVVNGSAGGWNDAAVYGIANATGNNIAVFGRANFSNSSGSNVGVVARAENADTNWAIYAPAGDVIITDHLGIGTMEPSADLDVAGVANIDSLVIAGNYALPSSDGSAGQVLKTDGSGVLSWDASSQWEDDNNGIHYDDHVGIGTESFDNNKLAVVGDSSAIKGVSMANSSSNWLNYGVLGEVNTANGQGRGVYGNVYGNNGASAVYGEAVTSSTNIAVEGRALSQSANTSTQYGVLARVQPDWGTNVTGSGSAYGAVGEAIGRNTSQNNAVGLWGYADGLGINNFGVRGIATDSAQTRNYGGYFSTAGIGEFWNIALLAIANGSHDRRNYGLYSFATGADTNYAAYLAGDVSYTGALTSVSDRKLKRNIQAYEGALEKVLQVGTFTYDYRTEEFEHMALPKGKQIGFVAQDLEVAFPDLVRTQHAPTEGVTEEGTPEGDAFTTYKGVNYIGMIPVLVQSIKEQQTIIDQQQALIEAMDARLKALEE